MATNDLSNNLAKARNALGLTQQQVADKIGVTLQAYQNYEYGHRDIKGSVLARLSKALSCSVNYILGLEDVTTGPEDKGDVWADAPIFGSIAAGRPIEMEEADDWTQVPSRVREMYPGGFFLKVVGESMNRILPNGSYAYISPCETVEHPGKPYAVCVNGYDATIKRVRILNNGFELDPDSTDPTFRPMVFDYGVEGTETITVIGEAVWFRVPDDWEF